MDSSEMSKLSAITDLGIGNLFMIRDQPARVLSREEQVLMTQIGESWVDSGSTMTIMGLELQNKEACLLRLNGRFFLFERMETVSKDTLEDLKYLAQMFGHQYDQVPGSVGFQLLGQEWSFLDIGRTHSALSGVCRYILAEGEGKILFILDHREDNHEDLAYIGSSLNLREVNLERRCPHCHSLIENTALTCPRCGSTL